MNKGQSYKSLPDSTILFICTFDPFGKGFSRYTFGSRCEEDLNIVLSDGATRIFYNCCYDGEDIPEDLKKLYEYIETGRSGSELTKKIDAAVGEARKIEEWRSAYMKEMVLLMDARDEGIEEGREEGSDMMSALIIELNKLGREGDVIKAAQDKQYREELMIELGIEEMPNWYEHK